MPSHMCRSAVIFEGAGLPAEYGRSPCYSRCYVLGWPHSLTAAPSEQSMLTAWCNPAPERSRANQAQHQNCHA